MKKVSSRSYRYTECGPSKIYLQGIHHLECAKSGCKEEELEIPNIEKLHTLIALTLASQKHKLFPEEIRFLRAHLGFTGVGFAHSTGVSPETVTRWEKGQVNMKETSEKLLRVLVLSSLEPFRNYDELAMFGSRERKTAPKRSFKVNREDWAYVA